MVMERSSASVFEAPAARRSSGLQWRWKRQEYQPSQYMPPYLRVSLDLSHR